MRIAILTLPLHRNYGGILQAYSLQTVLQRMGHDVFILDKKKGAMTPFYRLPFSICKRIFYKYVLMKKGVCLLLERRYKREISAELRLITSFMSRYLNRLSFVSFNKYSEKMDVYIVGSDQIWRPRYFKKLYANADISNAYLRFVQREKIRRIAYAVSFGADSWEYTKSETTKCRDLIQTFDAVSVREKLGVDFCAQFLNKRAEWVLDPTMLLDISDYMMLVEKANIPAVEGDLFTYILDDSADKQAIIDSVAKDLNLHPFKCAASIINESPALDPIEKWLRSFNDTKFVITDSFHACVFSILFRKPFIVIGNRDRGMARVTSLLDKFQLSEKLVYSIEDYHPRKEQLLSFYDYAQVHEILDYERKKSIDFIVQSLG